MGTGTVRIVLQCQCIEKKLGKQQSQHSHRAFCTSVRELKSCFRRRCIVNGKIILRVISSCAMQIIDSLSFLTTLCNFLRQRWMWTAVASQKLSVSLPASRGGPFPCWRELWRRVFPLCYALCSIIIPKGQRLRSPFACRSVVHIQALTAVK